MVGILSFIIRRSGASELAIIIQRREVNIILDYYLSLSEEVALGELSSLRTTSGGDNAPLLSNI